MTSILTGDIINSREVPSKKWLPLLKDIFNSIGTSPKTWEIYRGDSFQVEIEDVENAFLFSITLKAALKKIKNLDVRIAIGIGTKIDDYKSITEGSGQAFINSGKTFDTLLKKQNLAISSPWEEFDFIMNTALKLALLTVDHWSVSSADFVFEYFKAPQIAQKIIAQQLNISESSASERKKRAGLDELLQLENLYKNLITKRIKQ